MLGMQLLNMRLSCSCVTYKAGVQAISVAVLMGERSNVCQEEAPCFVEYCRLSSLCVIMMKMFEAKMLVKSRLTFSQVNIICMQDH